MEQTKEKVKIPYWDNFKGILIILVVFTHCLFDFQSIPLIRIVTRAIYLFHMPAFIFTTGYLSKSKKSKSAESHFRLLTLFFIFSLVMMAGNYLVNASPFRFLTPYNSLWYLLAVIVWRFTAEKLSTVKGIVVWSVIISLAVGMFPDVDNMLAAARIFAFYPFFIIGYKFPTEKFNSFIEKRRVWHCLLGWLILLVSAVITLGAAAKLNYSTNDLLMNSYESAGDLIRRIIILVISTLVIVGMFLAMPNRKFPLITTAGGFSLWIYLFHRFPTLFIVKFLESRSTMIVGLVCAALTLILVVLFGNKYIAKFMNAFTDKLCAVIFLNKKGKYSKPIKVTVCLLIAVVFIAAPFANSLVTVEDILRFGKQPNSASQDIIYSQLSADQSEKISDDVKLLFAGDLILLEDQVKNGYDGENYDFSEVFRYAKEYISDADLAIGVFEGPTAGVDAGYSTSNYGDYKTLALNFPDEFARDVKNAGFDFVTTANNHLLDKDVAGAMRTLDVLDKYGLDHIGSYRNAEEKQQIKIIEVDGIKIAFLAYTYGTNGHKTEELLAGDLSYISSFIVSPDSNEFENVKKSVEQDFKKAKEENPDLIIVMPHMGTQFLNEPDIYQKTWNEIFLNLGADIILSDHTHSVQPVEVINCQDETKIIVNCPGNFANIYREHNGDASAMVEIYIDKTTKKLDAAAVIPMWTQSAISGNYRAIPIYSILNNEELLSQLSTDDLERVKEVQNHITEVMIGYKVPANGAQARYFMTEEGYQASKAQPMELPEAVLESEFYALLTEADSVCFVGDSITEGTKNGGFGWYNPIQDYLKDYSSTSKGGGTVKTILPKVESGYSLYVVAIGTNDVRYRDESICAMTSEEYIFEIDRFVKRIRSDSPEAEIAFIAPWCALENDRISALPAKKRDEMLLEYSNALKNYCEENGLWYSNPNEDISHVMEFEIQSKYLVDHIHPNRYKGIELYCRLTLENMGKN